MFQTFLDRLENRARTADSLLCVGLDPHPELLPEQSAAAARDFCRRLIEATADYACAFKPNAAFFEQWGPEGFAALRDVIRAVPDGIPVILDAKRGDIASTAAAYARAAFDVLGADAITLSPYLGSDSLEPFTRDPARGAFVLCKTSNPGAEELQSLRVGGQALYEVVAAQARTWNTNRNVGLVVGATDAEALARVRAAAPELWFLAPGVGAQGGDLAAALRAGLRADGLGVLVNASRTIARATDPAATARDLRDAINQCRLNYHSPIANYQFPAPRLAQDLLDTGCVKFGSFTLKSGVVSPIYLDLRRLVSYPEVMRRVVGAYADLLRVLEYDHLAGVPYAALPIATAIGLTLNQSVIYARKETKDYGTQVPVEGAFQAGDTAVVIDDLATTGASKIEAIERLRAAGLRVRDVVVLVDRHGSARPELEGRGYRFHAVVGLRDLMSVWRESGAVTPEQAAQVESFLARAA